MLVVSVFVACSSVFVSWTTVVGAFAVQAAPETKQLDQNATNPRLDLKPEAASGYIFRHDGDSQPTLIRFGDHNLDQLEEFLRKTGFRTSLPEIPVKPPPHPVDDSSGHFPLPANHDSPSDDHPHVPFDLPPLDEDSVDSFVPHNFNDSGANYDYNDINSDDPNYDYEGDYEDSTESANSTATPADYSEDYSEDYTEDYPEGTDNPNSKNDNTQEDTMEDKSDGSIEPVEAQHHPPAKRLISPTVKAFIAPLFDLGTKGYAGPAMSLMEPLKYPTIGHHKNEPFHSPLVDDTYDDQEYRHHPKKYNKGGGSSYDSGYHSSHGDKGDKGYNNHHDFHDGEHGYHGKEGKKGYYNDKSGHKNGYHDGGNHYGVHHADEHGNKGGSWGETGHHKKGHKTTGYHNTYHKDEYKKEHKFYDDKHKEGYHDKHGAHHSDHGKHSGGKKHGGYHDSAYNEGHKGNSGFYDKGHYDNEHAGHKGASGFDSHFGNFDEFGKKSGFSEQDKFGFSNF